MKCINLKQKFNHKLVCKKNNKEINIKDCNNCKYKEYKQNIKSNSLNNNRTKYNKSPKLRKLERNRFSLFTDDLEHCIICGSTYKLTWHEIFGGKNRPNSMRYGLCLRGFVYLAMKSIKKMLILTNYGIKKDRLYLLRLILI